jgi:hypothetical protein
MMNRFAPGPCLRRELESTGYIHRPLPLHGEASLEARCLEKKVLKERVLWDPRNPEGWSGQGPGTLSHDGAPDPGGRVSLRMELPTTTEKWPAEAPDGDYTPFCRQQALFRVGGENWEDYNRISLYIRPDCPGARTVGIALIFANDGELKIPDPYNREGHHELYLDNRRWNRCLLEIPELPRDKITMIGFESAAFGKDRSTGNFLRFDIGEIRLQHVEGAETARGWLPGEGRIAYSMSGYAPEGAKTAILRAAGEEPPAFTLRESSGKTALEGRARRCLSPRGGFDVLDFSGLGEGLYTLHCNGAATPPFPVSAGIWADSVWKALNFVFCERCGYPVPEKHGSCHGDTIARHQGLTLVYNGGWHDAGDMSQQTLQSADLVFSLLELARKVRGEDEPLYRRLLEEAEWGLDFVLKCRFGDGFRASSAGIVNWSDGFIGNMDDQTARVQNNSFDNLLYAACEAYAAETLLDDPMLCERLREAAEEDFAFARALHRERGFTERPVKWEHSYGTSPSQYMATLSWAASLLYRLTGKEGYAAEAAGAIDYVLRCQRNEPVGDTGLGGFFYRDTDKRVIQHFNHQSRDQIYMQALGLLRETQPEHPESGRWQRGIEDYAAYLKALRSWTEPYGMLPSGVYHRDEALDGESFERQHSQLGAGAAADYAAQLKAGVPLDGEHSLRIFPVWFSFRGNSAVHLATGKAAAICGKLLGDRELLDIAREQLYWVVGKNPFCQSLMYGEGHNYPEQAAFLPGTMTGELPVGIQTRYNEDIPYWPQSNNATYKEVWLTPAGKWFSLVAELS